MQESIPLDPTTPPILSLQVNLQTRPLIPNEFPKISLPYRIAIITDCPGELDEREKRPLSGTSGRFLEALLSSSNILRAACFVGNLCQIRPPGNDFNRFDWSSNEIQTGLETLRRDLIAFQPNIIVLLGASPLKALLEPDKVGIADWRGSLLKSTNPNSPFYNFKVLPMFDPMAVIHDGPGTTLLAFDLKRARNEADSPRLDLPIRNLDIDLSPDEIITRLEIIPFGTPTSVDIEGGLLGWTMISVSTHPLDSFCICFGRFSLGDEIRVATALSRLLYDERIPKVLQNSLYDNFVLAYGFHMLIRNVYHDTMLSGWELYSELPKSLGLQASLWTKQPYYKVSHSAAARKERANDGTKWREYQKYCCIDSAVTLEISLAQQKALSGGSLQHYRFNVDMLNPLLFMELRGMSYDTQRAELMLNINSIELSELKTRINLRTSGFDIFGPKSTSPKKLAEFLYRRLGLPIQYKKEKGRLTTKETTDIGSLLILAEKTSHPIIYDLLELSKLQSDRETLEISTDPDGRVRCGYNVVGTETGRLTCYTSPTGSGANLTTITKRYRCLYTADQDYDMFQCDLAGADGWTVAAHAKRLGDATMFDDYLAGIKPARVLALMYVHGASIGELDRTTLLERCREVDEDVEPWSWLYQSSKAVQHGSSYGMGKNTMSSNILLKSFKLSGKPIHVEPRECQRLQDLFLNGRYRGVKLWQRFCENQMLTTGRISTASGHQRVLFGRKKTAGKTDPSTLKEAYAEEPQHNTTYATNLAMLKLWNDPENRRPDGSLIIEPLHQVHDALVGQWPKAVRDWAVARVRYYFDNPINIGGLEITIPFDGAYGPSWGELGEKYGGGKI